MFSGIVWRIYVGFVADIDIKILGVPPSRPGMPFLEDNTCAKGGIIYFCQGFLPCMMTSMDGWIDGWLDASCDEKASRKTTMTSYTICNT
jgi:hypothetical protein